GAGNDCPQLRATLWSPTRDRLAPAPTRPRKEGPPISSWCPAKEASETARRFAHCGRTSKNCVRLCDPGVGAPAFHHAEQRARLGSRRDDREARRQCHLPRWRMDGVQRTNLSRPRGERRCGHSCGTLSIILL